MNNLENNTNNNNTDNSKGYFVGRRYFPSKNYLDKKQEIKEREQKLRENKEYGELVETQLFTIYKDTINNLRKKTAVLYEKIHYLADNEIGNIFQQIKTIMTETTVKVSQMIQDLRNALGYNFTPSRLENNKIIPIEPFRIKKAWDMIGKVNFIQIENILMF